MILRDAAELDMENIYLMGVDIWGRGLSPEEYLKSCSESSKYKKGTWKVLTDGNILLSSLIIYKLDSNNFGIGSIATPQIYRKRGFATILIHRVIDDLKFKGTGCFLYADIEPTFYEKFGFKALSKDLQKYNGSICMKLQLNKNIDSEYDFVPNYF
jgi:predicted acetyltransferase